MSYSDKFLEFDYKILECPAEHPHDMEACPFAHRNATFRAGSVSHLFLMYDYKIRECPVPAEHPHDMEACPFLHKDEASRRRDPKKVKYKHTACEYFKNGNCSRGEKCSDAHGGLETLYHPEHYQLSGVASESSRYLLPPPPIGSPVPPQPQPQPQPLPPAEPSVPPQTPAILHNQERPQLQQFEPYDLFPANAQHTWRARSDGMEVPEPQNFKSYFFEQPMESFSRYIPTRQPPTQQQPLGGDVRSHDKSVLRQEDIEGGIDVKEISKDVPTPAEADQGRIDVQEMSKDAPTPAEAEGGIDVKEMSKDAPTLAEADQGGIDVEEVSEDAPTLAEADQGGIDVEEVSEDAPTPAKADQGGIDVQEMFKGAPTPAEAKTEDAKRRRRT